MAYKYDIGLEFLRQMSNEDLNDLVEILKGKDNDERISESLSNDKKFIRHYPDHAQYIDLILEEIQRYGGNTFVNIFRGGGVQYAEILEDVCKRMKVHYSPHYSIEDIELSLLLKITTDALEKMSEGERKELLKDLDIKTDKYTPQAVIMALQTAIKLGKFKAYQFTLVIVNAIWKAIFGKGLTIIGNSTLTRWVAILAGPIGWTISGIWTAADIAGPAYRVTIPVVVQIAYLRQKHMDK